MTVIYNVYANLYCSSWQRTINIPLCWHNLLSYERLYTCSYFLLVITKRGICPTIINLCSTINSLCPTINNLCQTIRNNQHMGRPVEYVTAHTNLINTYLICYSDKKAGASRNPSRDHFKNGVVVKCCSIISI